MFILFGSTLHDRQSCLACISFPSCFSSSLNRVYSADDDAANDDAVNDDAANDDAAAAGDDAYAQTVVPCEKGVVQVTGISLLCNSPYTYYWGNGANRNSRSM